MIKQTLIHIHLYIHTYIIHMYTQKHTHAALRGQLKTGKQLKPPNFPKSEAKRKTTTQQRSDPLHFCLLTFRRASCLLETFYIYIYTWNIYIHLSMFMSADEYFLAQFLISSRFLHISKSFHFLFEFFHLNFEFFISSYQHSPNILCVVCRTFVKLPQKLFTTFYHCLHTKR